VQKSIQGVFKKRPNFWYKDYCSFYSILSTVPFKVVPSTGDTPSPFLPLLECFRERTFCDGAQFSYCNVLNLLYGVEMTSFQIGVKFAKQEKVLGLSPENRVDGAEQMSDVLPDNCG